MVQLSFPDPRTELVYYLRSLADLASLNPPRDYEVFFREILHFLEDDWELVSNPQMSVGLILYREEIEYVYRVAVAMKEMMQCIPIGRHEIGLGRIGLDEVAVASLEALLELLRPKSPSPKDCSSA